jgi:hypothetical protein
MFHFYQVVKILLLNFEIEHTIVIYAAICSISFAGRKAFQC